MINPNFIHLHVRSDYSMVDGLAKIEELIEQSRILKIPALALTDFNNLFGCIKFYDYAHKLGIKPIVGADVLIQDDIVKDMYSGLTCLVMNQEGYHNLIILISKSYKNKSGKNIPIIQRHWLAKHNTGLLILSGGCFGDIGQCLLKNKILKIEQYVSFYKKYFSNRFYLELVRTGRENEENYIQLAIELSVKKGLPVVATNDIRFINSYDFQAHEIRVAIYEGIVLDNSMKRTKYSFQQFMKSEQEMCELFVDIPESLSNSVEISYRCNLVINLGKSFLPNFPSGSVSSEKFISLQSKKGLEERLVFLFPKKEERILKRKIYESRLSDELHIINQMGLSSYFLIVMEFIQWAKVNNIPVGPGRGSGASSLVAYVLKITELDPLKFDLLFERFLNPERISMPDLDIDFCMESRDLVIEHVAETYGFHAVSQIITFGTMTAKAVIRDVGRVLGLPYSFVNHIAKLIPSDPGITLKKSLFVELQLKSLYENNDDVKNLIKKAMQLEGVVKNVSKHAGGVVIAPTKIIDFSPLYYDNEHTFPITQFDKDDIERVGLIKFDFLGLRTLTVINRALIMINKRRYSLKKTNINIYNIALNDQKIFYALQLGETTAIFQLESRGIKELIKRLKPDCFEDLIALVALFRPGPLQSGMVDNFINRKHGNEVISYPDTKWQHDSLRIVLKSTYGIILYQEQVMQIAQVLAGYTLGNADILRRAIGKKKPEEMANQREIFKSGAIRNGIDSVLSMKIFDLVEKFAGYGFNKSHSAAYALISYHTLWLKTHYPAEFMAAALSSDMDNTNKIIHLINECKRMKLTILPPNINISRYHFYVNDNKEIVYGMGAIKGIGKSSIKAIITSREEKGKFQELFDFCVRIDKTKLNLRMIEKLIFSGAFDVFGINRNELITSLNYIMKQADQYVQKKYNAQIDMFEIKKSAYKLMHNDLNNTRSLQQFLLEKEKETLGLYFTNHPIAQYTEEIKFYLKKITKIKDIIFEKNNNIVHIFGVIISIRLKLITENRNFVICIVEDDTDRIEAVITSKLLYNYQYCLKENYIVCITGIVNINSTNSYRKIIVRKMADMYDFRKKHASSLSISLYKEKVNSHLLKKISFFLKKSQPGGSLPVYLFYQKDGMKVKFRFGKQWNITPTNQLLSDLRSLIGDSQVKLEIR